LGASFTKNRRSMLRGYKGANNGEQEHAHFVLLKWAAAVLRPYWDEERGH
jgi:hypothetical protein